eukprot:g21331.t1
MKVSSLLRNDCSSSVKGRSGGVVNTWQDLRLGLGVELELGVGVETVSGLGMYGNGHVCRSMDVVSSINGSGIGNVVGSVGVRRSGRGDHMVNGARRIKEEA